MGTVRRCLWLLPLLAGVGTGWRYDGEVQGLPQEPCSADLVRDVMDEVRTLLPLKAQVNDVQSQLQEALTALTKTHQYMEKRGEQALVCRIVRMEANAAERTALREDAVRLRSEVNSCRTLSRGARAELQADCVGKVMAVSNEAQREIQQARESAEACAVKLASVNNDTKEAELRAEILELRAQLEEAKRVVAEECQVSNSSAETMVLEPPSGRGGRGASDPWHRPKASPGKQDSPAVSKIPPTTYKHSCKHFLEPSAPVAPSPSERSIRIGNRQYLVGKEEVTWAEGWRLCKARGMWLLSLETEFEQQQLEPHMMQMHHTPTKYWLFARKPQGSAWYSWECAAYEDSQPWRLPTVARPGAGASVRCAHVELHGGSEVVWGDDTCDQRHHYICRKLVTEC